MIHLSRLSCEIFNLHVPFSHCRQFYGERHVERHKILFPNTCRLTKKE